MIIVVLMAGKGTRTKTFDQDTPKPFIKIHGVSMVDWVISNFKFTVSDTYVFVVQKVMSEKFDLHNYFRKYKVLFKIVELDGANEGAAISALSATEFYQENELLILNTDQYVTLDTNLFIAAARSSLSDGMILTMDASGPKWSYIKLNEKKEVIEVAEKKEISTIATIGAYWFKNGTDFVDATTEMISNNDRTNGEFYLAPAYNYMIKKSKRILNFHINNFGGNFFGLGTTEDIKVFEKNKFSKKLSLGVKF